MKRYKFSTFLFVLTALLILGSLFSTANANDAEIEALLDQIADLESELKRLEKAKATTENALDNSRQSLTYIHQNIENADRYIASARDAYAAADNEEEREDWAAVIQDLEDYRQSQVYQYNSVAYTIQLLEDQIDTLNADIAEVEKQIRKAYARLAELLND